MRSYFRTSHAGSALQEVGGIRMRELGFGLCSARLQAGICLILKCQPEGWRYKNPAKWSSNQDTFSPHVQIHAIKGLSLPRVARNRE